MSGVKRKSNHLTLTEPKSKCFKYNMRSPLQVSDFNKQVQFTYVPTNHNLKNIKMELEMNKIFEQIQTMQKQIKNLERQTKIQAEYIDELEHRNQNRIDDMSQLVNSISQIEIEKKNNSSIFETETKMSETTKLPQIQYDMSYIS